MNMQADFKPGQGEEIVEKEGKVSPRSQSRRVALQALYVWEMTEDSPATIIKHFNEDDMLENLEFELFKELLEQVVARSEALDAIYGKFLDRSVAMIDPIERIIMRMGCYELEAKPEIPYRVVINECVELAKRFGAEEGHKFINGILDKVAKEQRSLEFNA